MWIATTRGFYSVVQDRADASRRVVRARSRADLEALTELANEMDRPVGKIAQTFNADYPWRLTVGVRTWQDLISGLASEIDYDNFKTAVGERNRLRAETYHEVWSALRYIEREADSGVKV